MDCRNGAWAAFDRDNTRELLYDMPFSDFGAMIDPPTEDVTAHVLEMLAALGYGTSNRYVARGLEYLRETQRPTGSWFGRWGVNYVYGTWCVISALAALRTGRDMIEQGAAWLVSVQNADGGWGETLPLLRRRVVRRHRPQHGVADGLGGQRAATCRPCATSGDPTRSNATCASASDRDGTWDEPECTGTGFPRDFYINYHLYRHLFPMMALADAR